MQKPKDTPQELLASLRLALPPLLTRQKMVVLPE
jgi:hypothetical protein